MGFFGKRGKYEPKLSWDREKWRYNRGTLSREDAGIYDMMQKALASGEKSIVLKGRRDIKELMRIFNCVLNDEPGMFYVERNLSTKSDSSQTTVIFGYNGYYRSREKIERDLRDVVKTVFDKRISTSDSEYETELRLYDFLTAWVTYKDSGSPDDHCLIGPLVKRQGVCEGIAEAFAYLGTAFGLKVSIATGTLKEDPSEKHAWNIVEIDGSRYHVDATSDLGGNHKYFNCDDSLMTSHSFEKGYSCKGTAHNYYAMKGALFKSVKDSEKYLKERIASGERTIEFRVIKKADMEKVTETVRKCTSEGFQLKSLDGTCFTVQIKRCGSVWTPRREGAGWDIRRRGCRCCAWTSRRSSSVCRRSRRRYPAGRG